MFSHLQIWAAIDELARRRGWSASRLAVRAGLDPTSLNASKRMTEHGARWPSTETISKLLVASGIDLVTFGEIVTGQTSPAVRDADALRPSLLLVDDDEQFCRVMGSALREAGYSVWIAHHHAEALAIVEETPQLDILCTDLVMPEGLGGIALARLALIRRPKLKLVYVSGYDIPLTDDPALVIVRKPVTPSDLVAAVTGLLHRDAARDRPARDLKPA